LVYAIAERAGDWIKEDAESNELGEKSLVLS
jgi:hypothetical protein